MKAPQWGCSPVALLRPSGWDGRALPPPMTSALGALLNHVTGGHLAMPGSSGTFQPMNVNFGLFPEIETFEKTGPDGKRLKGADKTRSKKRAMALRALNDIDDVVVVAGGDRGCC